MAHKPNSFKIDAKKKTIVIYTNVEKENGEQELINLYLTQGFTAKLEEKKPTKTVDDMRKDLAADENALKAFNEAYEAKPAKKEKGKKVEFKETGFAKACKIYNDWAKKNKK